MSTIKKLFYASLFVLFFALLLWGVYNLAFKKTPIEAPVVKNPLSSIVPPKTEAKISAVSDEAVLSPILTSDGNSIKYYAKTSGRVYQIDLNGSNKNIISDKDLASLQGVLWSPDKNKVITKFGAGGNEVQFFYYDYDKKTGLPLKKNLDEVAWQANSAKIFYKFYDPKTKSRTLNVADPDGTNWNKLTDLKYKNVIISPVPKTGFVSFWNQSDAFTPTIFQSVPVVGGDATTILQDKFGADYLWDNSGNNVLASYTDTKGGSRLQLAVMNYKGGEFKTLGIPTLASKCAWSRNNKFIYYALPQNIPDNSIMPNDYRNNKFTTVDTFWKVDIASGEKTRLIDLPELSKINIKFDATNLFFNTDESAIFFVNKVDGKLYRLNI